MDRRLEFRLQVQRRHLRRVDGDRRNARLDGVIGSEKTQWKQHCDREKPGEVSFPVTSCAMNFQRACALHNDAEPIRRKQRHPGCCSRVAAYRPIDHRRNRQRPQASDHRGTPTSAWSQSAFPPQCSALDRKAGKRQSAAQSMASVASSRELPCWRRRVDSSATRHRSVRQPTRQVRRNGWSSAARSSQQEQCSPAPSQPGE
jgi:hypothetical protein